MEQQGQTRTYQQQAQQRNLNGPGEGAEELVDFQGVKVTKAQKEKLQSALTKEYDRGRVAAHEDHKANLVEQFGAEAVKGLDLENMKAEDVAAEIARRGRGKAKVKAKTDPAPEKSEPESPEDIEARLRAEYDAKLASKDAEKALSELIESAVRSASQDHKLSPAAEKHFRRALKEDYAPKLVSGKLVFTKDGQALRGAEGFLAVKDAVGIVMKDNPLFVSNTTRRSPSLDGSAGGGEGAQGTRTAGDGSGPKFYHDQKIAVVDDFLRKEGVNDDGNSSL